MYEKLIELLKGKYEFKIMHDGIIRINYNNVIMDITEGEGRINIYATEYQNGEYFEYTFTIKVPED